MVINILSYLENSAKSWPDKIALADDKKSISFKDWKSYAENIGTQIAEECRGAVRNPVLVFTDRTIDCLVGFMGVLESGNFYVPIDSKMPPERIKLICNILNPTAAIAMTNADMKALETISFPGKIFNYEDAIIYHADSSLLKSIRQQMIDLDPVYSIFTSGSTGVPKGVIISHRGMIDLADWLTDTFEFTSEDALGNQTPFYFDGSVKDICICLKTGATLNVIGKKYFSFPKLLIPFLNERRITAILWATSAIMLIGNSRILDIQRPEYLRLVTFAGEAMPAKQLNIWMDILPDAKFVNLYGPTEITVDCTYFVVDRKFNDDEFIPIGKACRNKQILIFDNNNKLVGPEEEGELCVRGSGVALGYYNNGQKSNESFVQNPLHNLYRDIIYRTGDIVKYNDAGEILFVSRKDFQIKHKGYRIELGEIEVAVNSIPEILNATCIFVKEKDKIVLFYNSEYNKDVEIIKAIKDKVPVYMFPEEIYRLDNMPYSMNGKIDRLKLHDIYGQINKN